MVTRSFWYSFIFQDPKWSSGFETWLSSSRPRFDSWQWKLLWSKQYSWRWLYLSDYYIQALDIPVVRQKVNFIYRCDSSSRYIYLIFSSYQTRLLYFDKGFMTSHEDDVTHGDDITQVGDVTHERISLMKFPLLLLRARFWLRSFLDLYNLVRF